MKDEEIKLDPEERELTWGGRDQQEGLWSVVDEVSKPFLTSYTSSEGSLHTSISSLTYLRCVLRFESADDQTPVPT